MSIRWYQYTKTVRQGFVDLSLDDAVAETFGGGAVAGQIADDGAWFELYQLIESHAAFSPVGLRSRLADAGENWPDTPQALRKAVMELVCAEILPLALEKHTTEGGDDDMEWAHEVQVDQVDADGAVKELDARLGDDLMGTFEEFLLAEQEPAEKGGEA